MQMHVGRERLHDRAGDRRPGPQPRPAGRGRGRRGPGDVRPARLTSAATRRRATTSRSRSIPTRVHPVDCRCATSTRGRVDPRPILRRRTACTRSERSAPLHFLFDAPSRSRTGLSVLCDGGGVSLAGGAGRPRRVRAVRAAPASACPADRGAGPTPGRPSCWRGWRPRSSSPPGREPRAPRGRGARRGGRRVPGPGAASRCCRRGRRCRTRGCRPAPEVAARRADAVGRLRVADGPFVVVAPVLAAMQVVPPTLGTAAAAAARGGRGGRARRARGAARRARLSPGRRRRAPRGVRRPRRRRRRVPRHRAPARCGWSSGATRSSRSASSSPSTQLSTGAGRRRRDRSRRAS